MPTPLEALAAELGAEPRNRATDIPFVRALRQVVCFPLMSAGAVPAADIDISASPTLRPPTAEPVLVAPKSLDMALADRFFHDLWVPRPEVERILAPIAEGSCLVILTGEKGAGKTTIL